MAIFVKSFQRTFVVNNVIKLISNVSFIPTTNILLTQKLQLQKCALIHTTLKKHGLMEFFDDQENWGKERIKVGRSWKKDELRLKSNEDLHKLWYVLLKEHNMLLTMEQACKDEFQVLANPERIDKVKDSMTNLEDVVRERNKAYHMLETGETGERHREMTYNALGLKHPYKFREYSVPKFMNTKWQKTHFLGFRGIAAHKFLRKYREKLHSKRQYLRSQEAKEAGIILKKFPNVSLEAMKKRFPNINVEKTYKRKQQEKCPDSQ